ncbi:MAG TPA: alpha/beta fold hydrolase [Candidatus Dormibacteraeota bacterium]
MASLLLVHGAWHGAWCWEDNVAPRLRTAGHEVTTIDLRHHGAQDRKGLRRSRIGDYVADVDAAAKALPAPLVVVGHSMGGLVVQRWLIDNRPAGAVLVAPVPVHGVVPATLRVARRHPATFAKVNATMNMAPLVGTEALVRDLFLAPDTPDEVVRRCHERVGNESYLAYIEMLGVVRARPKRVSTPMLVLGADADGIFSPREIEKTARAYGTEPVMLPGGHDMMLDGSWEAVAERIEVFVRSLAA